MTLSRRVRRWLLAIAIALALMLLAIWWIGRLLQPERLTAIVVAQVEKALGLEISLAAPADYALRPAPRLRLKGLSARATGSDRIVLEAAAVDIALPWATLTGGEPVITHLRLTSPILDQLALRDWLAQRPAPTGKTALPRLTDGLRIEDGSVLGDGWALAALNLDLPRFVTGERLQVDADGALTVGQSDALPWRLRLEAGLGDGPGLSGLTMAFQGASPLPTLTFTGDIDLAGPVAIDLAGSLAAWPPDWPGLPAPLSESDSPLPFTLAWRGDDPMESEIALTASRDQARFEGKAVPARLSAWLEADPAPLLPPLTGVLTAPLLEIEGSRLEGVRIELDGGDGKTGAQLDSTRQDSSDREPSSQAPNPSGAKPPA